MRVVVCQIDPARSSESVVSVFTRRVHGSNKRRKNQRSFRHGEIPLLES